MSRTSAKLTAHRRGGGGRPHRAQYEAGDVCECRPCDCELTEIPLCICACFGMTCASAMMESRIYVTLGRFSIIRLSGTPSPMPVYDYRMPGRECKSRRLRGRSRRSSAT